jgi:hypothetical protein
LYLLINFVDSCQYFFAKLLRNDSFEMTVDVYVICHFAAAN